MVCSRLSPGRRNSGSAAPAEASGPAEDLVPVFLGHAAHIADRGDGQLGGELMHDVDGGAVGARGEVGDELFGEAADVVLGHLAEVVFEAASSCAG